MAAAWALGSRWSSLINCDSLFISGVSGGIARDVPRGVHHLLEVVFVVDAGRHRGVILNEFLLCHDAIRVLTESHLEGGQEFLEDLTLSLATLKHSWVLLGVVSVTDVVVVDLATSVTVKLLESFLDEGQALWIQRAFHNTEELVIVNRAITILVECTEESLHIDVCEIEARLFTAFGKLLNVERSRAVIVHNLENTADANDRSGATSQHPLSECLNQV